MNDKLKLVLQRVIKAFQNNESEEADLILNSALQTDLHNGDVIFELGIAYAKANKLTEALTIFHRLQFYRENDVRIAYNIGLIYSLQGKHHLALEAYDLALKFGPEDVDTLINKASTCNDVQNYALAVEVLGSAIKIRPDIPEAWSNKGIALNHLELYQESIDAYDEALRLNPNFHEAWSNKSVVLNKLERFLEACEACDKALSLNPNYAEAWANKGNALNGLGHYDEAIAHFDKALGLRPDHAETWVNKGNALFELARYDEAIIHFDKALSLKPDFHEAWSNKGNALFELACYGEAIIHFDKALSLKPDFHDAWSNKGNTLNALHCYDEAIIHFDKALSLKPDFHEAWSNKGNALFELARYDEAIIHFDTALNLKPDYYDASWNKSLCLLLLGDFEKGLPLYESRWNTSKVSKDLGKRIFDKPTWLGEESLQDKTILLYGEQGLGDFLQFCRYAKCVSDLGAKVILEAPESLAKVMKDLKGVSQLVIKGQELPAYDFQCPLLSLPYAFNANVSNIPSESSYLISIPKKVADWQIKLGEKNKIRVGLAWSSTSNFKGDFKRSLLLADFIKALPSEGFEYICLQKEIKDCDQEFFRNCKNIQFFGDELNDLSDTAALIECVDLVISTCTSIPHLSAALGKKTWVLLSKTPDWRWLLDVEDSPWYPSMKLYRQPEIGDWDSVLAKVKADLDGSVRRVAD